MASFLLPTPDLSRTYPDAVFGKLLRENGTRPGNSDCRFGLSGVYRLREIILVEIGVWAEALDFSQGVFTNPRYSATLATMPLLLGPGRWHSSES